MSSQFNQRTSGVLLHPTSLPGPSAHGDLGPCARRFVDFLEAAGQTWWQVLPIHPIGGGDSPYDSPSAFAGYDMLISLEDVESWGLLDADSVRPNSRSGGERAQYAAARELRTPLLKQAFRQFQTAPSEDVTQAYKEFLAINESWVWDYGLFSALRQHYQLRSWVDWAPELRSRVPDALKKAHEEHSEQVHFHVFCQFLFHHQWGQLKRYANERGVKLMGDIPMFVSHDSVDVWANQSMFFLDENGHRTVQAGVPPDYFSEDGQLWGNPLYRWDAMSEDGFGWWIDRLRRELFKFDSVRIDHFIALRRYWEVPIDAKTAKGGRYVEVPGEAFLARAREQLGGLPFVAEDLGIVTPEVEHLRDHFELPGMKILQFAFSAGAEGYLPHRHPNNCVAYLGTHDNDTTRGWFEALLQVAGGGSEGASGAKAQLDRIQGYTGVSRTADVSSQMIRSLLSSPANTVVLTVQDLLDQGGQDRMNVPGVGEGNWTYRVPAGQLTAELAAELRAITVATERLVSRD